MEKPALLIEQLFSEFKDIRYVALYTDGQLESRQKSPLANSSSANSDLYEELLVNPVLLTAARQRGNIDCGGLNYILVAYGNFYQLIKETDGGHISICLDKNANLHKLQGQIITFLHNHPFR